MASIERLSDYLNDHLGGSAMGIDLAKESQRQNQGTSLGTVLATLIRDIEEDRDTLVTIIERLGADRSRLKEAGGWLAEKVSRVKFQASVGADDQVHRVLEIEALMMGIYGKRLLWLTLQAISPSDERLQGFDFEQLAARAENQLATLEAGRHELTARAFLQAV